jgi:hypothetical protein
LNFGFPAITRGLDPRRWIPFTTLGNILSNKFHQEYWTSRAPVSTIGGLLVGILVLIVGKLLFEDLLKRKKVNGVSFSTFFLTAILIGGVILSPLMGGAYRDKGICKADILHSYEHIGDTLNKIIPANSTVYWNGKTAVPLLYAPKIFIHYPQIYAPSYFVGGGDSEQLLKHGFWNADLAGKWLSEASYIVTDAYWSERPDYRRDFDVTKYNVIRTELSNPCDPASYFLIYQKKP